MAEPIRVLLVDDQSLVRSGFRMLIDSEDDMAVVGEASNGAEALEKLRTIEVDVALMDIRMPVMDGVETTRRIAASSLPTRVMILTTFDLDEYVYAALKAGASGFLLKDARPAELLSAIRSVADGEAVVAPSATKRLLDHVVPTLPADPHAADERLASLTDREREVLVEIAKGATNAEIAQTLYMAEGTVKTHIGRLLSKLDCRDRVGLVTFRGTGAELALPPTSSVDAAAARLAEAKGAVELMLAEAHVTRAEVALIAFRGASAELLLPPTRSLTRARRALADLPGGGGTPLAAGLDAARALAAMSARRGRTPALVLMTDGRANIAADGTASRARATADAAAAARRIAHDALAGILIDIAPRPQPEAEELAHAMRLRYLPLPRADAAALHLAKLDELRHHVLHQIGGNGEANADVAARARQDV